MSTDTKKPEAAARDAAGSNGAGDSNGGGDGGGGEGGGSGSGSGSGEEKKKMSFTMRAGAGSKKSALLGGAKASEEASAAGADGRVEVSTLSSGSLDKLRATEGKPQLVIPLIKNNWRALEGMRSQAEAKGQAMDPNDIKDALLKAKQQGRKPKDIKQAPDADGKVKTEDELLAEEIVAEARERLALDDNYKQGEMPILMQNMVPGIGGLSTDEERLAHDLTMRPDELDLSHPESVARYERTPVEAYGLGMLIGMGWTPGGAVGKNQQIVEPVEYIPRAHLQGLGASMAKPSEKKQHKILKPGQSRDPKPQMRVEPGEDGRVRHFRTLSQRLIPVHSMRLRPQALVEILEGPHAKLYGRITRVLDAKSDFDVQFCDVTLNISGSVVNIPRHHFEILDENALPEDHPAFKTKATAAPASSSSSSSSKKSKKSRSRSSSPSSSKRAKKERGGGDGVKKEESDKERRKREKEREKERERAERKEAERAVDRARKEEEERIRWVVPGVRVRVISQTLAGGSLYQKKGVVEDVTDRTRFTLVMDDGKKIVEGVKEKYVETALPKTGGRVRIVRGEHKDVTGALIERNADKQLALVQTEDSEMLRISFDDLAEWTSR